MRVFLVSVFVLLATPAWANEVTIPWGDWLVAASDTIASIAVPLLMVLLGRLLLLLPEPVAAFINTLRVEQLLQRAVDYGIQATKGAAKGQTLTVDVGSEVMRHALDYAVTNGPGMLIKWIGGPSGIRAMILARLDLEPDAHYSAVR